MKPSECYLREGHDGHELLQPGQKCRACDYVAPNNKAYLGDAVYVDHDGYGLWLTTEDGVDVSNRIYLEPEAYRMLLAYVARLQKKP